MDTKKFFYELFEILLIVGGLNWLLVGLFGGFDIVASAFGAGSILANVVYTLVGVSAIGLAGFKLFARGKY